MTYRRGDTYAYKGGYSYMPALAKSLTKHYGDGRPFTVQEAAAIVQREANIGYGTFTAILSQVHRRLHSGQRCSSGSVVTTRYYDTFEPYGELERVGNGTYRYHPTNRAILLNQQGPDGNSIESAGLMLEVVDYLSATIAIAVDEKGERWLISKL